MPQEAIAAVESTFSISENKTNRKKTPHRVKFNGKYIVTESKKTIWPSIGAAKNAIRNHINTSYKMSNWIRKYEEQNAANNGVKLIGYHSYTEYSNITDSIIKYLENNNIIEYVPYTDGE